MTGKVEWTLSARDQGVINALQQIDKNLLKLNRDMDQVGKTGRRSADRTKQGFGGAMTTLKNFGGQILGVGSAVGGLLLVARSLKAEYDQLLRRQRAAQGTQADAGVAVEKLRLNFLADKSIQNEKQLVRQVRKIATDSDANFATVAGAAGDVLSAKGDLSNKQALEALRQTLRVSNDPEFVAAASAGALDLQKLTGIKDVRGILGFARQTQVKARITSPAKLFQNLPSVVAAEKQLGGGDAESAAELMAFITSQVADPTGEVSRTGSINFIKALSTFAPQRRFKTKRGKRLRTDQAEIDKFLAAQTTAERLAVLQGSPEMAQQFLETANLGKGQLLGAFTGLVKGDKQSVAAMADTRQAIESPTAPGQVQRAEKFIAARKEAPFQGAAKFRREKQKAVEEFELSSGLAARQDRARRSIDTAFEKINVVAGPDFPAKLIAKAQFEGSTEGSPEQAAINVLEDLKTDAILTRKKEELQLLNRLIGSLEKSLDRATTRSRLPSSKLGRNN